MMFFRSSSRREVSLRPDNAERSTSRFLGGGLKRSAFTFESQQDFEDKIDRTLGSAGPALPALKARPSRQPPEHDVEAGASVPPALLKVPKAEKSSATPPPPSEPSDAGRGPKVVVPSLNVTAATPPSSPPESESDDSDSDAASADDDTGKVEIRVISPDNDTKAVKQATCRKRVVKHKRPRKVVFEEPQKVILDEKESYEFLQTDGRWHGKPRVYEYNKSAARSLRTAKPGLFYTLLHKDRKRPKNAMVIRTYQDGIVEAGKELMDGKVSKMLPQLLHKYCDALRDMDYMERKAVNGFDDDPFLLMTSKQMERDLMQDHQLLEFMQPHGDLPPPFDEGDPRLPGVGRAARLHAAQLENRFNKLACALGGGLALIIPMIVMRLESGTVSCLVTTSGSVLIFSLVIAYRSDMLPNEILAVTAAYTAVLVVFVGTTT